MALSQLANGSFANNADPGEFSYGTSAPRMSVTTDEAGILERLVRDAIVLEIGAGLGVSTRAMAKTASRVFTVDNDPWVHREVWPSLAELNVTTWMPEQIRGSGCFDVFVDGDHRKESVIRDIALTEPLCRPETLIVFHDVNYSHVRDAVEGAFPLLWTMKTEHGVGLTMAAWT